MSRGYIGQTPHTFDISFSQGLSNSVSLIGKFASASESGAYNGASYLSQASQTGIQNERVFTAQNTGKTVFWENQPSGGGGLRPYVVHSDGSRTYM